MCIGVTEEELDAIFSNKHEASAVMAINNEPRQATESALTAVALANNTCLENDNGDIEASRNTCTSSSGTTTDGSTSSCSDESGSEDSWISTAESSDDTASTSSSEHSTYIRKYRSLTKCEMQAAMKKKRRRRNPTNHKIGSLSGLMHHYRSYVQWVGIEAAAHWPKRYDMKSVINSYKLEDAIALDESEKQNLPKTWLQESLKVKSNSGKWSRHLSKLGQKEKDEKRLAWSNSQKGKTPYSPKNLRKIERSWPLLINRPATLRKIKSI